MGDFETLDDWTDEQQKEAAGRKSILVRHSDCGAEYQPVIPVRSSQGPHCQLSPVVKITAGAGSGSKAVSSLTLLPSVRANLNHTLTLALAVADLGSGEKWDGEPWKFSPRNCGPTSDRALDCRNIERRWHTEHSVQFGKVFSGLYC